jgi:hypothetical protein
MRFRLGASAFADTRGLRTLQQQMEQIPHQGQPARWGDSMVFDSATGKLFFSTVFSAVMTAATGSTTPTHEESRAVGAGSPSRKSVAIDHRSVPR